MAEVDTPPLLFSLLLRVHSSPSGQRARDTVCHRNGRVLPHATELSETSRRAWCMDADGLLDLVSTLHLSRVGYAGCCEWS